MRDKHHPRPHGKPGRRPPKPGRPRPQHHGRKSHSGHLAQRPAPVPHPPRAERAEHAEPLPNGGIPAEGVLELHPKGYGFLRSPARNYAAQPADPYVPEALIGRLHLRPGVMVAGTAEPARGSAAGPRLVQVTHIEGDEAATYRPRNFDDLTPVDPDEWIRLETGPEPLTCRVMDLFTPVGRGQRGLIVAPPRTGKTILLQHIGQAVAKNHPNMHLLMLLVDERPEEVTEMRRTIKGGEVFASSSDRDVANHIRLAELVLERAKRLAEHGEDVFVLLDSLTRLARAYNKQISTSGRTMTGGIDIRALEVPKRLFGQARAFEEGGSLTILGTALIETGSRMDDIIFEEFKGTGNMELVLDRRLAERRTFPAMDLGGSGTRKEEKLLPADMLKRITLLRRSLAGLNPIAAMSGLVEQLAKYPTNAEFLERIGTFVR